MSALLVLAVLAPAAPIPKDAGPSITCTVKRVVLKPEPPPKEATAVINFGGKRLVVQNIPSSAVDDGYSAEVTITNRSRVPFTFKASYGVGEMVYAQLVNAAGDEVSHPLMHTVIFSLYEPPRTHVIKPGEQVIVPIHLLSDVTTPNKPLKPGTYTVTVIFQAGEVRAAAAPVEVEVK